MAPDVVVDTRTDAERLRQALVQREILIANARRLVLSLETVLQELIEFDTDMIHTAYLTTIEPDALTALEDE